MFDLHSHITAQSVQDAIDLLIQYPDARLVAGGTDVLIKLRHGKPGFSRLIDIHGLTALRYIRQDENHHILIGSGTVFSDLIESDLIQTRIPVLADAAQSVGGPQIRNIATIGGNICNGVPSADSGPGLFALNARLIIQGQHMTRETPICDFYLGPGQVALKPGEVLTAIKICAPDHETSFGSYIKYAMRNAMDIATIGCGVSLKTKNRKVTDFRIAFGVAGPVPVRCPKTEAMVTGSTISASLLDQIADVVETDVSPRTSWRASREFRMHMIKELSKRATRAALNRAGEMI